MYIVDLRAWNLICWRLYSVRLWGALFGGYVPNHPWEEGVEWGFAWDDKERAKWKGRKLRIFVIRIVWGAGEGWGGGEVCCGVVGEGKGSGGGM